MAVNNKMFKKAIVCQPAFSMIRGITTAALGIPDVMLAKQQHNAYIETLQSCGLEVTVLKEDENLPDSVFIEDTAVLTKDFAIITNPEPDSRRGEIKQVETLIREIYKNVHTIESPGTIEGGDVMQIDDHLYVGLSERTNEPGADQFADILATYGYTGIKVPMGELLHLKTGVTYLEENTIVVTDELLTEPIFAKLKKIRIEPDEAYAANCIRVNDFVLVPNGYPKAKKAIEQAGFQVKTLDMTEFRKLDGGLSCLSLRF